MFVGYIKFSISNLFFFFINFLSNLIFVFSQRVHGSKRPSEMTRECSTINMFVDPDQPKFCVNCGINESNGEGYCNACGLYAAFDCSNSRDEGMNEINTIDYINNNINQSNLSEEIVN